MRVVSLLPSSTETVFALGCGDQLVGRSHECDFPAEAKKLPICSESKFRQEKFTSRQIHNQVQALIEKALSVYRVNSDRLKELKPDLIITQDHCEVCAVDKQDVEDAVCNWLEGKPKILTLHPESLSDVFHDMQRIADSLGISERGSDLIAQYHDQMEAISNRVKNHGDNPSVVCIEWMDPLMAAGNWMPKLVRMVGARDPFGVPGKHAPKITWEDLVRENPDVLLVMSCGLSIERNRSEIKTLQNKPEWKMLKAVKQNRVYLTEGSQYFNRPGPRLVDSLEILSETLYPQAVPPSHRGTGWQTL